MSTQTAYTDGSTANIVRDASDYTRQLKQQLTYQSFSAGAPNPYKNHIVNSSGRYIEFLKGKRDCDPSCTGTPLDKTTVWKFR